MNREISRCENSDIRIMSWNILSEELSSFALPISKRIDDICDVIMQCRPDAVGLQEVSQNGYALLNERIGDTYEFVNSITPNGEYSFTGVAYDKVKFELIESSIELFDVGNPRVRIMNWIYLRDKKRQESFILLSTHWSWRKHEQMPQALQMGMRVKELNGKYGCPVICVGDYNRGEGANEYKQFIAESGFSNTRNVSAETVNNVFTAHKVNMFPQDGWAEDSYDHIIISEGLESLRYEAVMNKKAIDSSDHLPIYADMRFKK